MGWVLLSLRRLRDGAIPAAGLAVIVAVTACTFAAIPRLGDAIATGLLRTEVREARGDQRAVTLVQQGRLAAGPTEDPLSTITSAGDELASRIPPEVARLATERVDIVDSQRWTVVRDPSPDMTVRLRIQGGVDDHVRLLDGRLPTAATRTIAPRADAPEAALPATAFEVAISAATAAILGVGVGDTIDLAPEPADVRAARPGARIAADVVGTFEVADLAAPYWSADTSVDHPSPRSLGSNVVFQDATALVSPDAYPALLAATAAEGDAGGTGGAGIAGGTAAGAAAGGLPFRYTFRLPADPARLEASRLDALVADLRRLDTVFPTSDVVATNGGTTNRSDLLGLVEAFAVRWRSAEVVLSAAILGAAVIALLALGLVATLAAHRRRPSLDLARGRGASTSQALASVVAEGAVLTVPAAIVGGLVALLLVPAGSAATSVALAAGVAALATAILVAVLVPSPDGPPPDPTRETSAIHRTGARRIVLEVTVVVVALAGAWALRERGLAAATAAGAGTAAGASTTATAAGAGTAVGPAAAAGVDPFVALVPALVGVAAGIVVVRLFPIPVRALARVAAARRGLVPAYALRRLGREPGAGLVLAVLMATATIATFCSVVLVHLDRAADAAAWEEVGAPFRVTALASGATGTRAGIPIPLPDGVDPAAWPGVEAAAAASVASTPFFPRGARLDLLAVETGAYGAVTAGTPAASDLPEALATPAKGTAADPIPAVVSRSLADGPEKLVPGRTFQLIVGGGPRTLRVVDVRDAFPTVPAGDRFAIVDLAVLRGATSPDAAQTTEVFLRAPEAAADGLRSAAAAASPDLVLAARSAVAAATRTSPLMQAVILGLTLAALVAALYAALAVSSALALSASARAVEVAHLRTLGLSRRQSVLLVVAEHGPTVAVAFVAGAALGVAMVAMLGSALGMDAIVGTTVAVPLAVEPLHLAGILAAVVVIVAIGMAIAAVISRRAEPALAVRRRMG